MTRVSETSPHVTEGVAGDMRTSQQRDGGGAEAIALSYLQKHGLVLLDSNFSCRFGEIDLLMRDGDTLVVTEVRFAQAASRMPFIRSAFRRENGFARPR